MRTFITVLALAVAGCAANSQAGPQFETTGTYKLIAVDGRAVPEVLSTGEEVLAGDLVLKRDGSFAMKLDMRVQLSTPEPLTVRRELGGRYTASPIGVQLVWRDNVETSGAFFGRTLRIYRDGIEYLFMK